MMAPRVEQCPFCQSERTLVWNHVHMGRGDGWRIICMTCDAQGPHTANKPELGNKDPEIVEAWNRVSALQQIAKEMAGALGEALGAFLDAELDTARHHASHDGVTDMDEDVVRLSFEDWAEVKKARTALARYHEHCGETDGSGGAQAVNSGD